MLSPHHASVSRPPAASIVRLFFPRSLAGWNPSPAPAFYAPARPSPVCRHDCSNAQRGPRYGDALTSIAIDAEANEDSDVSDIEGWSLGTFVERSS